MSIGNDVFSVQQVQDYGSVVRPQLKSGDLMLCSGSAFFSNLIKDGTDSVFSHVAFIERVREIDRVVVLESVESIGIRTVPISRYLRDYDGKGNPYPGGVLVARHSQFESVATNNLTRFAQFAVSKLGYRYNTEDIVKIAARVAAGKVGVQLPALTITQQDTAYICSEYVYACYQSLGIELQWSKQGFIAPGDIARDADVDLVAVLKR